MWEADEQGDGFDPAESSPEYQMWKDAKERLRDTPCACGYFNSKTASYCVKCEAELYDPPSEDPE